MPPEPCDTKLTRALAAAKLPAGAIEPSQVQKTDLAEELI
jgi:hypothetical protein